MNNSDLTPISPVCEACGGYVTTVSIDGIEVQVNDPDRLVFDLVKTFKTQEKR